MRKIYHIAHDPAYASIVVEPSPEATDISCLQAEALEKEFKPPACRLKDNDSPIGDFIFLNETALVFTHQTNHLMGDFIEHASMGEMYHLDVEGAVEFCLLNVVENCNPLNKKESEWVPNSWEETLQMNKLVFHPKRVFSMSSLFKIPELDYKPILCFTDFTTDDFYQEHDFYKTYHEHGLTGLKFNEVWSD